MPATFPPMNDLAGLVGSWTGAGEVFPNPWGPAGATQGEWRFHLDGAGCNLIHDYHEIREDGYVFEGHGVLTVDPTTQECLWFWFDSYGFPPLSPARGQWQGTALALRKVTPRGETFSVFVLHGDTLIHTVESCTGGAFEQVAQGTYHRVVAS